jgi:hypothetical protein
MLCEFGNKRYEVRSKKIPTFELFLLHTSYFAFLVRYYSLTGKIFRGPGIRSKRYDVRSKKIPKFELFLLPTSYFTFLFSQLLLYLK